MKRIFLSLCLILTVFSISFAADVPAFRSTDNSGPVSYWKKYHVTGAMTLSGGCTITYDLWVDVTIVPPRFNGITGTLTMSGNCSGTQNINARASVNEKKKTTDFEIIPDKVKLDPVLSSEEFKEAMKRKLDEANLFSDAAY